MKPITPALAEELVRFAPTADAVRYGFGESQLQGAVCAYNMLARNRVAYLADEVGMGKTYVALGVLGLLRHLHPDFRIMVLAPRENIQIKWIKELRNFVRINWRSPDNRMKSLQGTPVRRPLACAGIPDLIRALQMDQEADLFLRMTTFSLRAKEAGDRRRLRRNLLRQVPWLGRSSLNGRTPDEFIAQVGRALNKLIPSLDLLIVDEAHNLKHGYSRSGSIRNRVLAHVFGRSLETEKDDRVPRVRRLLLLSATPFEGDYGDLGRQIDLFGLGDLRLVDASGQDPQPIRLLTDSGESESRKRELVSRFLVRRTSSLNLAGVRHSRNMYRREWRSGGLSTHDEAMHLKDPHQRLAVALIQKKVAEVLGDRRFNHRFQIGMLSSFESFLETLERRRANEDEAVFDGDQEATVPEREGIDTRAIEKVVRSHRERFRRGLPHPKLDATAASLADCFHSGEKALVFVRRVTTTGELKKKVNVFVDAWIRDRMIRELPGLKDEVNGLFRDYEKTIGEEEPEEVHTQDSGGDRVSPEWEESEEPEETRDSFFGWFFRGKGPEGILSGGAFQKNRLASMSSAYSTLFEDDLVSWLLNRPENPVQALAELTGTPLETIARRLRERAYHYFRRRTQQKEGYPRAYVYEAYQVAGLESLAAGSSAFAERAETVLRERYEVVGTDAEDPPEGFPWPEAFLGAPTFFTELEANPTLRSLVWPERKDLQFREAFRDREQRRELISAMSRLGAAFVDLYLLAVAELGSFKLGEQASGDAPERLARDFVTLLDRQRNEPGFHAYFELSAAAATFDTLLTVNYPDVPEAPLSRLAEIFGRSLQHQMPVARMHGGVNPRTVRQFRMPGFPLVLISTDVLQEGEDLHTFCRRVVHYGISWTPSAMEQRTGRVDRIGSLFQRKYDGREPAPDPGELIQVYYPYLQDTVEVLQVERVLERLNRFLRMIHKDPGAKDTTESRIETRRAMIAERRMPEPIRVLLESAFPVLPEWLEGTIGRESAAPLHIGALEEQMEMVWGFLCKRIHITGHERSSALRRSGIVLIRGGEILSAGEPATSLDSPRRQAFDLGLRSLGSWSRSLLRISSPVGSLDLLDNQTLDRLYDLQRKLDHVKVCAWWDPGRRIHHVEIRRDLPFDRRTTQPDEVEVFLRGVVSAADEIEQQLLSRDADPRDRAPAQGEE